jgi:hypothetical protein
MNGNNVKNTLTHVKRTHSGSLTSDLLATVVVLIPADSDHASLKLLAVLPELLTLLPALAALLPLLPMLPNLLLLATQCARCVVSSSLSSWLPVVAAWWCVCMPRSTMNFRWPSPQFQTRGWQRS